MGEPDQIGAGQSFLERASIMAAKSLMVKLADEGMAWAIVVEVEGSEVEVEATEVLAVE